MVEERERASPSRAPSLGRWLCGSYVMPVRVSSVCDHFIVNLKGHRSVFAFLDCFHVN